MQRFLSQLLQYFRLRFWIFAENYKTKSKQRKLSVSLSVCLTDCLSVWLTVCLTDCLSVCLSVCLPACLSVCLPVCLPVCLSVCLPVCLSVCLSVSGLPVSLPVSPHGGLVYLLQDDSRCHQRTRLPAHWTLQRRYDYYYYYYYYYYSFFGVSFRLTDIYFLV